MVLGLGLDVGLGFALIIHTCCANLVLRVIWHCDVFGMTGRHTDDTMVCNRPAAVDDNLWPLKKPLKFDCAGLISRAYVDSLFH